ncbi:MAG: metallophosphoesterase [Tannerella sp.]|jgi:predicted MPP superfamily phosphohydrolase|nr:metallophosphoesterase [Tannerella sp.]
MNRFLSTIVIVISCNLITGLLSGCKDDTTASKEEIMGYYEINRQNCLSKFLPATSDILKQGQSNMFKLMHISDAHLTPWSSNNHVQNPSNLNEAIRFANDSEANIDALVDTGDHIGNNPNNTTRELALTYMDAFARSLYFYNTTPTFASTGNHDSNMLNRERPDFATSKSDIYNHVTSQTNYPIHSPEAQNYYYADLPNPMGGTIRIIALDVIDQEGTVHDTQRYATFSQQQIDWFCRTALKENMTANHSVIVLVHHPLSSTDEGVRYFSYDEYMYGWKMIPEIIEAFRSKNDWSQKYPNRVIESDSLSVNVSFRDTPGEFICYLGGHIHTYLNYEVDGFRNLNPALPKQIMIIANNMSPSDKSPKSPIERNPVGLQNNTFNLYAINTSTKTIYITFFGATSFYYRDIIALSYLTI